MRSDDSFVDRPPCRKCGDPRSPDCGIPEPWCRDCARKFPDEWRQVLAEYVADHGSGYLEEMGVPKAYRCCSFANFEVSTKELQRVLRTVETWAKDGSIGLYLCGDVGLGKTHLAVGALLAMRARGRHGWYVSAQEFLLECRDSFRSESGLQPILDEYSAHRVLVLDDLGSENSTEFARETLGTLVDRAYRNRRPQLIVTSNLDLQGLAAKLDARIADRLIELCQAVKLTGVSYRQQRAAQRAIDRTRPATWKVQ